MNKDQKLLEEAYESIYESLKEPLYFGPIERKREFLDWLEKLKHEVHSDGSVSVEGDVNLIVKSLRRIPFNFGVITGNFYCYDNNLTSLEGAPIEVAGGFYCGNNNLTSLEGAPKKVGGIFSCSGNKLTSLEGAPIEVGGNFVCGNNNLTSLEGAPIEVGGNFNCGNNKLTSLEGAPKEVGGYFHCGNNKLTSLEGAPEVIKGEFSSNQFSDAEYRSFVKKRKYVDDRLSKDLNIDLEDFS